MKDFLASINKVAINDNKNVLSNTTTNPVLFSSDNTSAYSVFVELSEEFCNKTITSFRDGDTENITNYFHFEDGEVYEKEDITRKYDELNRIYYEYTELDYGNDGTIETRTEVEYIYQEDGTKEEIIRRDNDGNGNYETIEISKYNANEQLLSLTIEKDENKDGKIDQVEYSTYGENETLLQHERKVDTDFDGQFEFYQETFNLEDGTKKEVILLDEDNDGEYDVEKVIVTDENDNLISLSYDEKYLIDGEIGDFKQGRLGDCWFLSGLDSLSNTSQGRKLIQDAIKVNSDDTYTVTFNGVEKSYIITKEELNNARMTEIFSTGDDDVLLLEVAAKKMFEENPSLGDELNRYSDSVGVGRATAHAYNPMLDGGNFGMLLQLFSKEKGAKTESNEQEYRFLDLYEKQQKTISACVNFHGGDGQNSYTMEDINGNEIELGNDHAWSIKCIEGEHVTMVNPWNSSEEVVVHRDGLVEKAFSFMFINIPFAKELKNIDINNSVQSAR